MWYFIHLRVYKIIIGDKRTKFLIYQELIEELHRQIENITLLRYK